jgi:endoglucanase
MIRRKSKGFRTIAVAMAVFAGSTGVKASQDQPLCYRGVNLSGAEYGDRSGVYGTNYTYPSETTIGYFAGKGMTVIRLPVRWERLQPTLNAALDVDELQRLADTVALVRKSGMSVVIDPHNFAYYDKTRIGNSPVTNGAFVDFWARLAAEFSNQDGVLFGLMNEPHDIPSEDWLKAANAAIRGIRAVGARNLVLVPGTAWSGVSTWQNDVVGGANGRVMVGVRDPANNYAYEVHQYLDADSSGTHATCEGADAAIDAIGRMTSWLRQNGKRGFLGEFGVSAMTPCVQALDVILRQISDNSDVWLGWSYWAAGEWWPPSEPFNVQPPHDGSERPQMTTLARASFADGKPPASCAGVAHPGD